MDTCSKIAPPCSLPRASLLIISRTRKSVDLTRLPLPPSKSSSNPSPAAGGGKTADAAAVSSENVEYSSREVKPSALILQDLLRAHSIFLLHHDSSLSALFMRSKRTKFSSVLGRYWDQFLSTWNVLLHGNPIRNILGGVRIAACGELGMGVGEEERGSGEREVLEGLVGRIDGLVDLVVSKFGSPEAEARTGGKEQKQSQDVAVDQPWMGAGHDVGAEDGAIFLGVGALSRHSLRDITYWMEDMFTWGETAYGVIDSPTATRTRHKRAKTADPKAVLSKHVQDLGTRHVASSSDAGSDPKPVSEPSSGELAEAGGMDKFMNYLKLGYGTSWSLGGTPLPGSPDESVRSSENTASSPKPRKVVSTGHYLIGLIGDIEEVDSESEPQVAHTSGDGDDEEGEANSRTSLRTVTVELEPRGEGPFESETTKDSGGRDPELATSTSEADKIVAGIPGTHFESLDQNQAHRLRVVVYVNRPFMFTFLFQLHADSLSFDALYRSLHYQLAPLKKQLLSSSAYRPGKPEGNSAASHIYDLVWDPRALTIHSTIPNIPEPSTPGTSNLPTEQAPWGRVEALNTHTQLLASYAASRNDDTEIERTCKTSRGWWIVWSRILERETLQAGSSSRSRSRVTSETSSDDGESNSSDGPASQELAVAKEIVLIRKAGDHDGGSIRSISSSYMGGSSGGGGWADGASRLAQGIGVDTRKYIEGLLSLNR